MTTSSQEEASTEAAAETESTPAASGNRRREGTGSSARRLLGAKQTQSSITFLAFLALFIGFAIWLGAPFTNADSRMLNVHQNTAILLLGLAALVTLVPGMFDLSIASMATLTTFLTIGLRTEQEYSIWVILVACLGVGALGGLLNGLLVERLNVNTFIATLGTGGLFLGASAVYSSGAQVAPVLDGPQLPTWFLEAGLFTQKCPEWLLVAALVAAAAMCASAAAGLRPAAVSTRNWLVIRAVAAVAAVILIKLVLDEWLQAVSVLVAGLFAVTLLLWVLMQHTSFGRHLRAVGSNRTAAQLAGVPVRATVIQAFVLGGVLSATAGIVLGSTQIVAVPNVAVPYLLPAFAAAFLSTVVFSSGQFTVWGSIIGGVFLVWVSQGLILGGLAPTWADIVNGAVLVVAVGLSGVLRRART
jgi:ribose/xylose/arabinose/galactoside ABC-type transport system permease subunit